MMRSLLLMKSSLGLFGLVNASINLFCCYLISHYLERLSVLISRLIIFLCGCQLVQLGQSIGSFEREDSPD